jgi:hypothetical protein
MERMGLFSLRIEPESAEAILLFIGVRRYAPIFWRDCPNGTLVFWFRGYFQRNMERAEAVAGHTSDVAFLKHIPGPFENHAGHGSPAPSFRRRLNGIAAL